MFNKEYNVAQLEEGMINPQQWTKNYADYLYSYAVYRVDDAEQARDLVQETFLSALERMEKFEGRSSEKTWLTSILKNKIFDIYRSRSSGLKNMALCEAYPQFFNDEGGHWKVEFKPKEFTVQDKDALESKEFNQVLQQCLKKLPTLWMDAFRLKFLDFEDPKDICKELNISSGNYWVIIHRAKVNLRACLQKHWL